MKYRKRPVEVEAEQRFLNKNVAGVFGIVTPPNNVDEICAFVCTINGQHVKVVEGDWIITESDGLHHYPCTAGEFERIYEPIVEA